MIKIYKKLIIIIVIVLISSYGYSQTNEIAVKFIGNCGLYLTDGNLNFYIDFPYKSGAHNYMEYDKSEIDSINENPIFIYTHKHSDHYSKKLLKKLNGKKFGPWNVSELEKLGDSILDFKIEALKTDHKVYGIPSKHYSYLIIWHGKKIYLNGDTGDIEPVSKVENIEWVFAPFWLYRNAMEENIIIDTKMFGIYHLYPNQEIGKGFSENVHFMTKQNEIISIPY